MLKNATKSLFNQLAVDKTSFFISLTLSIIGILFIYSSQVTHPEGNLVLKQVTALIFSLLVYFFFAKIDYHFYGNNFILIYIAGLLFLIIVLFFGRMINGSTSWVDLGLFHIQMAEFAKITYILSFATFMMRFQDNSPSVSFFFISAAILLPYAFLLLLQPDMGTCIVFVMIFITMFFLGGGNIVILLYSIPIIAIAIVFPFIGYIYTYIFPHHLIGDIFWNLKNYFILTFSLGILAGIFFLLNQIFRYKVFFYLMLILGIFTMGFVGSIFFKTSFKPYHYNRILVVFNPSLDPAGKGYNINQSLISIGSGRLTGQGYTKGSQNRGNFLPAKNTDFIIALIAEEWGFLGVIFVIGLNIFLTYRIFQLANESRDYLGFLISCGIGAMICTHFIINILSTIGFLPVIGIPLPFVSYGGSSLLNNFIALGILYNINNNRYSFRE
jgi:rod shape determining protein RodA